MRTIALSFFAPLVIAWLVVPAPAQQADYVVLAGVAASDPFDAAATHLAEHHGGRILRFDPADAGSPASLLDELKAAAPRHVALVMRPEQLDIVFQRRFLGLATRLDEDPFVDFAFGYITGASGAEALALARRGTVRQAKAGPLRHATVAGGVEKSMALERPHALRTTMLDAVHLYCAGEKAFPDEGRDRAFLAEHLPKLTGRDTVTFIGHGMPREVHGGPDHRDLVDLDLSGAVVLNVACYTGTTRRFFEDDYRAGRRRLKAVPLEESFCLALLRSGVVGYTAYLCPRPAGPELDTDLSALLADGLSLGEARRRDYDKTVLGFLGFGEAGLVLPALVDGDRIAPGRDPVRDMMLVGAAGGVVFGDPACVPFAGLPDQSPVAITVTEERAALRLRAKASVRTLYLHCSDPTAKWGGTMAMKVYARLPLGERLVADVVVDELLVGRERQPSRVLWVVEEDHGERFLQLKVNFPRGQRILGELSLAARVVTTKDPAEAKTRGGEVQQVAEARGGRTDVHSREIQPRMLELATARDVSREALQAAVDASAALLAGAAVDGGDEVMAKLRAFESEGFRAVCALLEAGHAHFRTWEMLKLTWQPGDERHLIALAAGPELPNYASWTVLRGLGVADTPEVRAVLLARLESEQGAGLYMSTAQGLALLGVPKAAAAIGDRVLEFRGGWSGVEGYLIAALGDIGGPVAIGRLEKIALHPRCGQWQGALRALERLDPAAAKRVRAARDDG